MRRSDIVWLYKALFSLPITTPSLKKIMCFLGRGQVSNARTTAQDGRRKGSPGES